MSFAPLRVAFEKLAFSAQALLSFTPSRLEPVKLVPLI